MDMDGFFSSMVGQDSLRSHQRQRVRLDSNFGGLHAVANFGGYWLHTGSISTVYVIIVTAWPANFRPDLPVSLSTQGQIVRFVMSPRLSS